MTSRSLCVVFVFIQTAATILRFVSSESSLGIEPQFLREPQNISAFEGSQVSLDCEAKGSPTPTLIWFRNEQRITFPNDFYRVSSTTNGGLDPSSGGGSSGGSGGATEAQETLLIPKVTRSNRDSWGSFFCIANNKHGSKKSHIAKVSLSSKYYFFYSAKFKLKF
ncbi:lachesin-like [Convolutriloba macropyga]|uniref:lachesin-like n=1 Tax=Convolutriloba macropyga TaxID=536237 RepID=UPI003F52183C